MARYLEITPLQSPFDMGLDTSGRAQVVFNVMARKTASGTFIEEIIKLLTTAGAGTSTNIFATSKSQIPPGAGPFLSLTETGGAAPLRIHNQLAPAYERVTMQIMARASTYDAARTMARNAYNALAGVRNTTVTP